MREPWENVPLGDLLVRTDEATDIVPTDTYREVTIRLWGKGVVQRHEIEGQQIAAKRRFVVRENQFILSRIDARNGAFGLVPANLDGAIVSNDFPSYKVAHDRVLPSFLGWMSRTRNFVSLCQKASEGTTNRVRLQEGRFLATPIQLPSLSEQRRVVAKIDQLAQRIDEAKRLRVTLEQGYRRLCRSLIGASSDTPPVPMSELVDWRKPDIDVDPLETYHFAGVYCFGRGVFRGDVKMGADFSYKKLTQIRAGEFIYPKLMAWEGAMAIVPPECDGLFVSPEFPVFVVDTEKVLPDVLDVYFRNPAIWPVLSGASTGTNVRRRRLNPKNFLKHQFPVPDRRTQEVLQAVRAKIDATRGERTKMDTELDALLPSILDRAFKGEL